MKGLHLDIVSPEKEIFTGEVDSVTLPGTLGSFTILVQHAPIVSSLKAGTLAYVNERRRRTCTGYSWRFCRDEQQQSFGLYRLTLLDYQP